jgi:hypothetical protein
MDEKTDIIKEAPFHDLESDDVGDGEYQTADAYDLADKLAKEAESRSMGLGLHIQLRGMLQPSGVQKDYDRELFDIIYDNPDGVSAPFIRVRNSAEITLDTFHAKDKSRDAVLDMGEKLGAWIDAGAQSNRLGGPK